MSKIPMEYFKGIWPKSTVVTLMHCEGWKFPRVQEESVALVSNGILQLYLILIPCDEHGTSSDLN